MKQTWTLWLVAFFFLILINCGGNNSSTALEQNSTSSMDSTSEDVSTPKTTALSIKFQLPSKIKESSGLIHLGNNLWTHNDSGDKAKLYQIDKENGNILKVVSINNATNIDWEDMAYDENYIYIGDFGNNNGNRTDLKIYKILQSELNTKISITAELISFRYSDQETFNDKNFDCEAMIVYHEKIYLFSKDWKDKKTRLYELDTIAGKRVAQYRDSFNIKSFVTGATINKELNILLLTTYSPLLQVDIWSFSNYTNSDFFQGEAKKFTLKTSLQAQVEGVTFKDNYKAYLSSESFYNTQYGLSLDATLYEVDFSKEFE